MKGPYYIYGPLYYTIQSLHTLDILFFQLSSNKRNSINAKPSARKGNFTHYLTEPTFLTKSLQKNCLYVHEKLQKKNLRWKGLKICHFSTL